MANNELSYAYLFISTNLSSAFKMATPENAKRRKLFLLKKLENLRVVIKRMLSGRGGLQVDRNALF